MNKLVCFALAAMVTMVLIAEGDDVESARPQKKVVIRISNCETPDSRLPEWKPPQQPVALKKFPWSQEQIAKAPAERAQQMVEENAAVERANFELMSNFNQSNWQANIEYMKGVRSKLAETAFGQQVLSAIEKFNGVASDAFNPDCISYFDTLDLREANAHQQFESFASSKIPVETYFLKLFFENPTKIEHSINLGDGPITRTKWIQRISFSVKDSGGQVACAGNFKEEQDAMEAGEDVADEARVELIEKCLQAVAKKVNDKFVATVVFKAVSSMKGDEDFDGVSPSLTVDGVSRGFDESVSMLKSDVHTVVAEADGYRTVRISRKFNSGTETIKFAPTTCLLTINVKGPKDFDPSSLTIELVGKDGESASFTPGDEQKVAQGQWTATVADLPEGYEAKPVKFSLTKVKDAKTIAVTKAAASETAPGSEGAAVSQPSGN